uniref:E3 ubiquitin-protein ligase CIP8 n=1 Tax=Erigeron canadensis TaxID=72917 RepID=UPI001CB901D6|nr:E3 ubiquitin-protein ligase CIP8 [Erigeron canadensis]
MAETPSSAATPPPPPPPTPPSLSDQTPQQYWCYQCDKRVPIETLPDQPDVICFECKNGFVELISVNPHHTLPLITDDDDDDNQPAFGHEFLQVLRLIAQAARDDARGEQTPEDDDQEVRNVERDDDAPENEARGDDAPPPPPDRDGDVDGNDYLRIELDGWNDNDDNNDDDDDDDEEDDNDGDGSEEDEDIVAIDTENEDVMRRRQRREVIRLQLRDFATRALTRRNRVLDWAEILMGLEDHSIEFRFQVPGDSDGYIGNPGDYVDAAGYEALLQNLAESDNGSRRGAPPAAKSAVEGLKSVDVKELGMGMVNESEVCAICKDKVFNNEKEIVKELPCGHMYHQECIVPWLGSRNTCPICRYELPTDDPEYEEERKKRANTRDVLATETAATTSESSNSSDGV